MGAEKSSLKHSARVGYKCRDCKWLNGVRTTVGIECTHPNKKWKSRTAKYHKKSTPACKLFNMPPQPTVPPIPYEHQKASCEIPMKLPSLNDYINICRTNPYEASKFKKNLERDIALYLKELPVFENPIKIAFYWIEKNKRRDLDNICASKKFILDAMVKAGIISDDNRKHVVSFTDLFEQGAETMVKIEIEEVCDGK